MLFSQIVGHEELKARLVRSVLENRVSHALLFAGPEGNGALALAIAMAQFLNCTHRLGHDSCGECPSCRKYSRLVHPDLHFVFPVVNAGSGKKSVSDDKLAEWRKALLENPYLTYEQWLLAMDSENRQAGIFVDESDNIVRKLQLTSFESDFKVMILWLPEKMNQQAANKILKIVEEPPSRTLFLFVSEAPMLLLSTIRSRTQLIDVPRVDDASVWNAQTTLTDDVDKLPLFSSLMRGAWIFRHKANISPLMEWCDQVTTLNREQQKLFLFYALNMIRQCFLLSFQPGLTTLSAEEQEFSSRFSVFITPANVSMVATEFSDALRDVEANGNKNLIFIDLGIKLGALLPSIAS